ncbi:glycosyltransferase family 2 protein [Gordonia amicalis]|uniref:glycosyltransferase n=1 Tax=Gordonia amicalis TaxID=89053 RepID=UPI0022A6B02A|nr:glycosyltransferase family 2 protein [Gordonia amicalis]MCZ0914461.1 glycosyltransferase family 2 protein [Gordonia amicalis]
MLGWARASLAADVIWIRWSRVWVTLLRNEERSALMAVISVVVPAYNEEATIATCLDHLLNQTRPPEEILVVDNASTDRTPEIVREYAARYPTIRVVDESTPGIYSARRAGFDAARGDIIARTDADTFVSRTWCEGIDAVLGDDGREDAVGATGPTLYWGGPAYEKIKGAMLRGRLAEEGGFVQSMPGLNTALRATAWREIRDSLINRVEIWEDMDLSMAMRDRDMKVFFTPAMLVDTSIRQVRHSPWRNRHYILGGIRTAFARGDRAVIALMFMELPVRLTYTTVFWLIFGPWDDEKKNWRLHRLFSAKHRERPLITSGREGAK